MLDTLVGAWAYAVAHSERVWRGIATHAHLSGTALAMATVLAVTGGRG